MRGRSKASAAAATWREWLGFAPPATWREWRSFGGLLGVILSLLALLWLALLIVLVVGLAGTVARIGFTDSWAATVEDGRLTLFALAGLTAALAAIVAFPFTILRLVYTRRQTEATEQGLVTDRINEAVKNLGTEKTTSRIGRPVTIAADGAETETEIEWRGETLKLADGHTSKPSGAWQAFSTTEPNLEVRIGAILELERLARANLDVHVQIMEILCAYIRQNAPATDDMYGPDFSLSEEEEDGPLPADWDERLERFRADLAASLANVATRSDIQLALDVIGRRTPDQLAAEASWNNANGTRPSNDDLPDPDDRALTDAEARELGNAWRRPYHGYRLDLRQTDLRKADLTEANLQDARLNGARLQGARLDGARLQGALLGGARLQGAWLGEARLQGARLDGARLQGAWLGEARLQGAWLGEARLQGAWLVGARLQGAWLGEARLQGARLDGARLQGARLGGARLQGARLVGARLQGARLDGARLQGALLDGARLQGALLGGARLQGALLGGARLQGARLGGARLQGARLDGARLQGARLDGALFDAETEFRPATLQGAGLRAADCSLIPQILDHVDDVFGDASVTLPNGIVPGHPDWPSHWWPEELSPADFGQKWRAWQAALPSQPAD